MWQPEYPDSRICRTRRYIGDLWECLAKQDECPHGMKYGAEHYCLHRDCGRFGMEREH